jgi:hypothetical protein
LKAYNTSGEGGHLLSGSFANFRPEKNTKSIPHYFVNKQLYNPSILIRSSNSKHIILLAITEEYVANNLQTKKSDDDVIICEKMKEQHANSDSYGGPSDRQNLEFRCVQ